MSDDATENNCFKTEFTSDAFRVITSICFLFLSAAQGWFGAKILSLEKHRYEHFLTTPPETMATVNIILIISFATRSLYQLLALNRVYILPDIPLQVYINKYIPYKYNLKWCYRVGLWWYSFCSLRHFGALGVRADRPYHRHYHIALHRLHSTIAKQ